MRESKIHTPCYIVQERALKENLEQLAGLARETGCRILLAQKAFSMFRVYPLIGNYLAGTTASGLYEARLGAECMGKENHIFSPAYRPEEMGEILSLCGHVVLNSPQLDTEIQEEDPAGGEEPGTACQSGVLHPGGPRHLRPLRPRFPAGDYPLPA